MELLEHVRLLAEYNRWMNDKVYAAAALLSPEQRKEDREAFFGSIFGTLNHLLVADIIWLKRFAEHPAGYRSLEPLAAVSRPKQLDTVLFDDFDLMARERTKLDALILRWVDEMTPEHLAEPLTYRNMKGQSFQKGFGSLLMHMFNHQTHHRGQATTLLSQAGIDVGVTDLLALIPDREDS